ncbi:TIGR00282 family metallophosphoesterase [Tuwongella immobilis]|uniref:TIGR00282 family metallophosphoesterase n=1 Tax=Tuwongella immobilis TaxID=692036 RepID=A0A6C2YT25_9BACT|nr:TIGR00282 family metallophosphoesterase [Tuwongella immobilis]VIP04189.1 Calcineurin-like phosphoesterase OS=Pirellula staleyi (strain ATCC 27377 / DSM 6068 / ICPB 4128) GN=Psta_3982 PE=4 SV=1: YmdB [Tuwongella immobilis]VTS05742.1 Calcineurin-like phosphoesterase OS=Pirellula staleyi (strain ATCC 27377 / DSM 6068 / ICPB 4128) GN=Psta_3982 PE=4 SV=1: YmdB [Tuwongella immobilis]
MRVLFIGDIVGQPGVELVRRAVPFLRQRESLDLVVANAENASNGSGMLPSVFRKLRAAGVNAFTMGDHIYKKGELISILESESIICKPANYPPTAPGRTFVQVTSESGHTLTVISVMGRTFMRAVDCPFAAVERVLAEAGVGKGHCVLVDVHAEATADKYLVGHFLDGRVSAVLGTHTHVPTADEQILPNGTAFQCDVGMTGPYHSIIGRDIDRVLQSTIHFTPVPFDVASGDIRLGGVIVDIQPTTGRATGIRRICLRERELAVDGASLGESMT